ncbi:hypothetical protein WA026_016242 [Henosepilachna vigintioctopunctata]|uniref:Uncharacterized protein n=1 Tax=Henosepilachna vigintioctopunctata TaxID=420089 RepID=A0AAW1TYH5_9CUCU
MEAVAKYDFNATAHDELSFKKTQILKILSMEVEKSWYLAELNGREGMIPSNYIEMKYHRWYYGKLTRAEAETLLVGDKEGAFLIRTSISRPGQFSLSIKCLCGIQHFRIFRDEQCKFFLWHERFNSINELLKYYYNWSVCRSRFVMIRNKIKEDFLVQALYDFQAEEPGELEFRKGDILTVKIRPNRHWWYGEIGDRKGLFPAKYVALYSPQLSLSSCRK